MKGRLDSFFSIKFILRLYHTLRYLKLQQVFFRIYYPVKNVFFRPQSIGKHHLVNCDQHVPIQFPVFSIYQKLFSSDTNSFSFLNRKKSFSEFIDWEFSDYGLLWSFHLHYFDWLNDNCIDVSCRLNTLQQYINQYKDTYLFQHSYPASLRIVNSIKFLIEHDIRDEIINAHLYRQSSRLCSFPEYDLMANHLLENGIALLWAGIYFGDARFEKSGKEILNRELNLQVLHDGIHFEKSPAYQSIITKNLLCLLLFVKQNKENELYEYVSSKCKLLLSGLTNFANADGKYINFGDSNSEMSILLSELLIVAQNLHIKVDATKLYESGYRLFESAYFKLLFNSGSVPCSYQPGHIHADAFSFCLNINNREIIVDRGVSTYEVSGQRSNERGTEAHNTICVAEENSSDIWSSFRMGQRAQIYIKEDSDKVIDIEHDGYRSKFGIIHRRRFEFSENFINISDNLEGQQQKAVVYLHFHPDVEVEREGNEWLIRKESISIRIENCNTYLEDYQYCTGFNKTRTAQRIVGNIHFSTINTVIKFIDGETN